ncbi:type I-F CRISPR-associated endoribonuclease Cas6/Csy4 [Halomonas sp. EGI 63088]|uniref:Type I-F CRISPR-associated endoribonuclease Cas6/Csy4 n=1 Tax=Halomonas flagellata TaxID=2920385 RepID=A0ABS9RZD7_9GAMM|nr:type I-F CRISPR-associated endoribonuclease Cas6/Csy4 [Halomonas flagellata]MCH4565218.1 type I-F CRISPR-associated endoribonuclease Cas6/Csy4 [Halomonas flagellata]
MDYYIDIRLLPDPEFPAAMLMGALFSKLHRALVDLRATDLGVSFPEHRNGHKKSLGQVLRLHGSAAALDHLMATGWLKGMRDHISASDMAEVPADTRYLVVCRRQFKTSAERLRRRRARRHGETLEQAREHIPDSVERKVDLPFATIRSLSTRQTFHLFVEHGDIRQDPVAGRFNAYGLSDEATVPWF